ncbi:MAG: hypothetical protein QOE70_3682 [Chthoniobacter sp.]|jgi:hypothetical protein|nr:hypothetical protein [Chthoniobacter sp.]
MREYPFSSFQTIARHARGRKLVLFGAGEIAVKTVRKLPLPAALIVDNDPNLTGTRYLDLPIHAATWFGTEEAPGAFVVICTTSFTEVAKQLEALGLVPGKDFAVSPILNDLRIIADMESCEAKLLFSSGGAADSSPAYGGGVYELELRGTEFSYRKVYSGTCHGMLRHGDRIIAVDHKQGIIEFNPDYSIKRTAALPAASRAHGITFSEITGNYYVVASFIDQVLIYDADFQPVGAIPISNKRSLEGAACHHCNDICSIGHSLFVSMFSATGNWKRDVFDGVVLEIDATSQAIRGPAISDLWMPHNPLFLGGSLTLLDSLRGMLRRHNAQPIGQFPGFSRGLAYDGTFFYIGQSRNRNYSKMLGVSNNISIDTAIIVFDEQTKVSRSLQLPSKLSEIHAILAL